MNRQVALAALAVPALAITLAFFVVPLVVLLAYSFMGFVRGEVVREATLVQYATLLADPFYLRIIGRTLMVAAVTTVLCVVLGYPVAWHIVRARPRWRPLLLTLILTPLLIGGVVRGYGWILILDENGLVNALLRATRIVDQPVKMLFNFFGVVVTMVEVLIPFFILPLIGSLTAIDPLVERAALSMGATRVQAFLKVILPLSLPGLLAGASIVFSLALNIFVVPRIIGGASYLVLATLAYQQVGEVGNMPFGSAIAAVMLVLTLAIVAAVNLVLGRRVQALTA